MGKEKRNDMDLHFRVNAHWMSGSRGAAEAGEPRKAITFSAPAEFHGEAGFWTPEHFFLAAAASCFVTTFHAIAGASDFETLSLTVSAEGIVEKGQGGYAFSRLILRPQLTIPRENDRERAARLLEKTERSCLVSRSLKCEISMEPAIEVVESQASHADAQLSGS
jgi:peroxiredoxin-like protein